MKPLKVLVVLVLGLSACGPSTTPTSVIVPQNNNGAQQKSPPNVEIDISNVATRGNFHYITIGKAGNSSDNAYLLLQIFEMFEKAHPDLEIQNFWIDITTGDMKSSSTTNGVIIKTHPKSQ